jgi:hypothetical protein
VRSVLKIREMAIINPDEGASAAQMLIKHFNGFEISPPRNQVPKITNSPAPAIAATRAPTQALPSLKTHIGPKTLNISAYTQYRVKKAHAPHTNYLRVTGQEL